MHTTFSRLVTILLPLGLVASSACGGSGATVGSTDDTMTGGDGGDGDGDGDGDNGDGDGDGDGDSVEPLPNGSSCEQDADCESQTCTPLPLGAGSICSECKVAQDCVDAGAGRNCALIQNGPSYYVCSTGELGETCTEAANCADGTFCADIVGAAGIKACSECGTTADCPAGQVCAINDPEDPSGTRYKICLDEGSLPNDSLCDLADGGDAACAGYCVAVPNIPIEIGVCGDCRPDAMDCPDGTMCKPPTFSPASGAFEGSICEESSDDDDDDDTDDDDDDTDDDDDDTGDDDDDSSTGD